MHILFKMRAMKEDVQAWRNKSMAELRYFKKKKLIYLNNVWGMTRRVNNSYLNQCKLKHTNVLNDLYV